MTNTTNVCMFMHDKFKLPCMFHACTQLMHVVLNLQLQIATRLRGIFPEKLQALVQGLFRHCQKAAPPKSCDSIAAPGRNSILEHAEANWSGNCPNHEKSPEISNAF